ncbi:MAG: right-handed parallel beta-helix repeat-containing protein [Deltaproteobacteria bacterium]|nr:right-handed parallel beta-helix repeat-containing protein [Deltaproteobacteria bacterium]
MPANDGINFAGSHHKKVNQIVFWKRGFVMKGLKSVSYMFAKVILTFTFLLFLCIDPCFSQIYYVNASNGSDTNDGLTGETAYKTLSRVSSFSFLPGDSILLKRGETWNERLSFPSSGSEGNPITIGAYGTGNKPKITNYTTVTSWDGPVDGVYSKSIKHVYGFFEDWAKVVQSDKSANDGDSSLTNGNWDYDNTAYKLYYRPSAGVPDNHTVVVGLRIYGIKLLNLSYINIENLDLQYHGGMGIYVENCDHINIDSCDISYCYEMAIQFRDTKGYCTATNNTITKCGDGIYWTENNSTGSNLAANNTISYCNYEEYNNNDGHGVGVQYSKNTIVRDNIISYCRMGAIGLWCDAAQYNHNIVIANNIISNCRKSYSAFYYGVGIICGPDPSAAADVQKGLKIYRNTICNVNYGIKINRPTSSDNNGNKIFNNTIHDTEKAFRLSRETDYNVYKNNIVSQSGTYHVDSEHRNNGTHNLHDYTCYNAELANGWLYLSGMKANFSSWQSANSTYNDPNSFVSDPLFSNPTTKDFTLQQSSPCIDAAGWLTTITSSTAKDQTSFTVNDASYFHDGFNIPGESGSIIKTQNGATAIVTGIDYTTNTLTVSPGTNIVNGEGISLDYEGNSPDIGANELLSVSPPNQLKIY